MTLLTTAFAEGTHAGRPAAGASNNGFYYYETDTLNLFQSNGSSWTQIATSSPLTTKGDLFGFSTANARLPVGSDTQVLTADSTQTLGIKWAATGGVTTANAEVTTDQSTSSAAYTDLATTGPSFSITVGSSGNLLVGWNCQFDGTTNGAQMSIALSVGNTVAANDQWALYSGGLSNGMAMGRTYVFTGLAAGATTVTAKYKSPSAASVGFQRRSVWAMQI